MAKKKTSILKILLLFILTPIIAIAGIGYFFMGKTDSGVIEVRTAQVERRTIVETVTAIGRIQPEIEVKVSSETSGEIIFLGVKEGDTVSTGQLLVKIKPDIVETQLEQQRAAADAAKMSIDFNKAGVARTKAEYKRLTELFAQEFTSKQDLDRAKASYEQADANYRVSLARYKQSVASLKQVQRSKERTTILAPVDGIITLLNVEKGEKVLGTIQNQGTEIMRISDLSIMNAVVDVDENDVVRVSVGDTARIEVDAFPDEKFDGTIIEIGHSAKVTAQGGQDQVVNFAVKVRLLGVNPQMRPGMSCDVDLETEIRQDVISIPLQAVTVRDSDREKNPDLRKSGVRAKDKKKKFNPDEPQKVVFVKKGNKAKRINVEVGISDKGFIEITEGLKEDDVIISGNFRAINQELYDDAVIKVDTNSNRGGRAQKWGRGGKRKAD